ncbi:ABC transporter ATP-binding protein [Marinoscillum furvescens]|uniref:ABC-type multidrug transport system ATPase subunit n=1 Tax=Marinoscillum furvescens DSM 4134 TaxID=1122208 RepID=A0A3D9L8N2_MARFU|nr:ABC transporter ATP-binding protein [Marinoscillum furvescens]REE01237.1 ABC-type multidrug transport system ATPase subunit [Marinoscillum furvescens DSM 4134]
MTITLEDIGKKYHRNWIFRKLNAELKAGEIVALTGHNGSGKSTLLKILSGYLTPSEGAIHFGDKTEHPQLSFGFAAPYQNLIEEFTLAEHLKFHAGFKNPLIGIPEMMEAAQLSPAHDKPIREFSSGMKQRVKLALAFFYEGSAVFLDEPTSNLDESGVKWYHQLLADWQQNRSLIIASNQPDEYRLASQKIFIENYKPIY